MHTYLKSEKEPAVWWVVFEATDMYRPIRSFTSEAAAAAFASYLNGGERLAWEDMK